MRILKLVAIFMAFVGAIFVALYWDNIFKSVDGEDDFVKEDLIDIGAKCSEIRTSFGALSEYDHDVYKLFRDDINQSKGMGMFSREGYNTVNNCLRESATNAACEAYKSVLHGDVFSESKLKQQYTGVELIKKAENLGSDSRISEVESIHSLYNNIKSFIESNHTISPRFDTENTDWTSFATLQASVLSKAKSFRSNPLYKELEKIPGFENGLQEETLKLKTGKQRASFYNNLSSQIVSYFSTIEQPTQETVNLFNQIYKNFAREDSDHGLDTMAKCLVDLKSKIE